MHHLLLREVSRLFQGGTSRSVRVGIEHELLACDVSDGAVVTSVLKGDSLSPVSASTGPGDELGATSAARPPTPRPTRPVNSKE